MKLKFLLPAFLIIITAYSFFKGEEETVVENVSEKLEKLTKDFSKEKIYLHLDKPMYEPGEIIWFSAYVRSVTDLSVQGESDILHVSIADPQGKTINVIQLIITGGKAKGDFKIPEEAAGGGYKIKAWTNWQNNFPDDYKFQKEIMVYAQDAPDLLLKADYEQKGYFHGDVAVLKFEAKDQEGKPIINTSFSTELLANGEKIVSEQSGRTDENGKAEINLILPSDTTLDYLTATVHISSGGKSESLIKMVPMATVNFTIEFYPEGGELLSGIENKVAFRAADKNGNAANVSGEIKNKNGKTISPFVVFHQGTGVFYMTPKSGEEYFAELNSPAHVTKKFPLREVKEKGVVITGKSISKEKLELNIKSTHDEKVHLIAHHNGKKLFAESFYQFKGENKKQINISEFPMGVSSFTLFNNDGIPVSERLFFLNQHKRVTISFETKKKEYRLREKVEMKIKATDENGKPVKGDFSIAVADNKWLNYADDKSGNILSSLLLEADLEGKVDEPNFYLDKENPKSEMALDLLMLTRGWRTFKWNKIYATPEAVNCPSQKKLIAGIIYDFDSNEPAAKQEFIIKETGEKFTTDINGNFILSKIDLNTPKTIEVKQKKKTIHYTLTAYDTLVKIKYSGNELYSERHLVAAPSGPNKISGTVLDNDTREQLPFVNIRVKNTNTGAYSDIDGNFMVGPIAAGNYTLEFFYIGYKKAEVNVMVKEGLATKIDVRLNPEELTLSEVIIADTKRTKKNKKTVTNEGIASDVSLESVEIISYRIPLISADQVSSGGIVTREDIIRMPTRSVSAIVETVGGVIDYDESDHLNIRGSRSDATQYYIDGVKVNSGSTNIPRSSIEQITVITGGIPANYGDLTGGVVNITTRNSRYRHYNYYYNNYPSAKKDNVKRINSSDRSVYYVSREFPKIVHHSDVRYDGMADNRTTLYWNNSVKTNDKGEAEIEFYTSDEITSFKTTIEGIGSNGNIAHEEFTFASVPELAIESFIPEKLVCGDTVTISSLITNRSSKDKSGTMNLFLPESWKRISTDTMAQTIKAGESKKFSFTCRVGQKTGKHTILIEYLYGKNTENTVLFTEVYPYGYPATINFSSGEKNETFEFELTNSDFNYTKASLSVYPSQLSAITDRSAAMLKQPSGCFEQVSSKTYPNLLVLNLIRTSQKYLPEMEQAALKYIEDGYNRLAKYETSENGFSLYGSLPANTFLSAYGLNEFTDMKKVYGGVNEEMLGRTKKFILSKKDGNGGFVFQNNPGENLKNCLNTYTVWSLVNAGEAEEIQNEILQVVKTAANSNDAYLLGIAANILFTINKKDEAEKLINKLLILQEKSGAWTTATTVTYSYGKSQMTEATSVCLLALMNKSEKYSKEIRNGINYLGTQFTEYGFGNTQATVLALKALCQYEKINPDLKNPVHFDLMVNGKKAGTYTIQPNESKPFEIYELEKLMSNKKNKVEIKFSESTNIPSYYFNINYFSHRPDSHKNSPFELKTIVSNNETEEGRSVPLSIKLKNISGTDQTNAMIEYKIPQGFRFDPKQLKELQDKKLFAYYEEQNGQINFYIDKVNVKEELIIPLNLTSTCSGKFRSPASKAYPYYGPEFVYWSEGSSYSVR